MDKVGCIEPVWFEGEKDGERSRRFTAIRWTLDFQDSYRG